MVSLTETGRVALACLLQRLKWPVPMSRWRAAKEIGRLLVGPATRSEATSALLDYLGECRTESEVCEVLTIVFLTPAAARPQRGDLIRRVHCPSILADMILERTYGPGSAMEQLDHAHSGPALGQFRPSHYFREYKTAHVPPILENNLRRLEAISGYPFFRQWAYEWQLLREKLGTAFTDYPRYFEGALDIQSGVVGQYWQRMRDVYLSAYLRALALAVCRWGLPRRTAESWCHDVVHGIGGLFDLEPGRKPGWLADFPERFCSHDADLDKLVQDLVRAARSRGMRLVSLDTPAASSVQNYSRLTLSAHLVTPDFEPPNDGTLSERLLLMDLGETFELRGRPPREAIEDARREGEDGNELAVCVNLFPMPFGHWHGDLMNVGMRILAPCLFPDTEIRCTNQSIDCISADGRLASTTILWLDDWTPQHPREGVTRCGFATLADEKLLATTSERLGRTLAFFARMQTWGREKDYGNYVKSERTTFVRER